MPTLPSLPSLVPTPRRRRRPGARPETSRADAIVDCAAYIDGRRVPDCADPAAAVRLVRERKRGFVWVGLHEPSARQMAELATLFGLHELAVEDAVQAYQRPKMERYATSLFLVLKTVKYVDRGDQSEVGEIVQNGEIMMFIGVDFIVTVRHGSHSPLTSVRAALEADPEQLAIGPAAVMHGIADRVVDEYVTVVDQVEDDIDEMENAVFASSKPTDVEEIYLLKRSILGLRRAVTPLMAPLRALFQGQHPLVPPEIREYFRDVEDHLSAVADRVTGYDELLTTLVSAALTEVTTQQNADMRKISAWAAIALVPTAIAGIYGMNFQNMPELDWTYGYPMALGLIACVCVLLFVLLRRRGWL